MRGLIRPVLLAVLAAALAFLAAPGRAADLDGSVWRVALESGRLGPIEFRLAFEEKDGRLVGRSLSRAIGQIRELPGAQADDIHIDDALFTFSAKRDGDSYTGETKSPWRGDEVEFRLTESGDLAGSVGGWLVGGSFTATRDEAREPLRDYASIWRSVEGTVAAKVFEPKDLESDAYQRFLETMRAVADVASDDLDLLVAFRLGWTNDPFSHFELRRSPVSAERMFRGLDDLRIGRESARVRFDADVAILRVDTMMGNDTIEQIEAAYDAIAEAGAKALVIDLVGNGGGAFAVKPLVEHVIDEPFDAGYFVSQKWKAAHDDLPSAHELDTVEPWHGWKLSTFWRDVQELGLMKLRFEPAEPNFDGPVFVAIDERSASATELAADALLTSGEATLVGERTAGEMLSQSLFDAKDGFIVSVPVADYVSASNGRIEGVGVAVDVKASGDEALETAIRLAHESLP